jgi:hypothetical protein
MENLPKDFVPYNFALRMKRIGFDEPCMGNYFHTKELRTYGGDISKIKNSEYGSVTAPTFSQAFRWFREEYKLHNGIVPYYDYYYYLIKDFNNGEEYRSNDLTEFIYEKAELACLEKLLEIVEENLINSK